MGSGCWLAARAAFYIVLLHICHLGCKICLQPSHPYEDVQPVFDGQSLLRLDHEYSHVQQSPYARVWKWSVYIYIHRVYQYIGIPLRYLKIASFIENMINKQWIWGYYIFRHIHIWSVVYCIGLFVSATVRFINLTSLCFFLEASLPLVKSWYCM